MAKARRFLIVDFNPEGRQLLGRTVCRRFAECELCEAAELDEAIGLARKTRFDAIIVHRPIAQTGEQAVEELRRIHPKTPIVLVSSTDRKASAAQAGANAFLLYDQWLLLPGVVADLLSTHEAAGESEERSPGGT